jgi:hypothetical protein
MLALHRFALPLRSFFMVYVTVLATGCGSGGGNTSSGEPASNAAVTIEIQAAAPGASLAQPLSATFARAPSPASVNTQTVYLLAADGAPIEGTVAINETSIIFTPQTTLALATTYTFVLTTALQDVSNTPLLAEEKRVSFTTRDGAWQAPQTLISGLNHGNIPWPPGIDLDPQGNAVLAVTQQQQGASYPTDVLSRRFDRATNTGKMPTLVISPRARRPTGTLRCTG